MNRRHFMSAAALGGFSVFTPWAGVLRSEEPKAFNPYPGPYWLTVNLLGGWDTTMFCDPKGSDVEVRKGEPINRHYSSKEIVTGPGGLKMAPATFYGDFLERHHANLTFVNGIDAQTNGHTQGVRASWSGQLGVGYPSLAAVIAAGRMAPYELPLPFLTFGGYEATGNLVAPTRMADTSLMFKVVAPNTARFREGASETYQDDFVQQRVRALAAARLKAQRSNAALPRTGRGLDALFTARLSEQNVGLLLDRLDIDEANALPGRGDGFILRQAYIALSAFEAGLCVSANLTLGGWDSHGSNDDFQNGKYTALFDALSMITDWAKDRGIQEKLNIVVASDFGRTPFYNDGNGKDHWSVSSWMIYQGAKASGLRVLGATDDNMQGVPMAADGSLSAGDGIKLTPAHLHNELRALAGVAQDSPIAMQYPLAAERVKILT